MAGDRQSINGYREPWLKRAARLLREAHANAEAGDAEGARTTAHEAIYALQVELGEEPDPNGDGLDGGGD